MGAVAMVIGLVPAAMGHNQHGGTDGHLIGSGEWGTIDFVSKLTVDPVEEGVVADLAALGNWAYVARWESADCAGPEGRTTDGGIYVINIADPNNPKQVGFIPAHQDTLVGEGMQVMRLTTSKFTGDVLVVNHEGCTGAKNYKAGMSMWDVSNPRKPVKLSENIGDYTTDGVRNRPHDANQVHSVYAWDAGTKAYAVMVDDDEATDVDMMDITNPRKPKLIAEFDLNDYDIVQPEIGLTEISSFLHDMTVKKIDGTWYMLLSYWDGGYVILNVDDPANPEFVGDTEFTNPDPELLKHTGKTLTPEGNAHQAEWTSNNEWFVATDEDFDPYRTSPLTRTTGPGAPETYETAPTGGGASVTTLPDKRLNGPVVYGGYGCPDSTPIPSADSVLPPSSLAPGEEQILVLQRGPVDDPDNTEEACFPGEKADTATDAGWDAVVLTSRHLGDAAQDVPYCGSGAFPADEQIVTVCTTHTAMHELFNRPLDFSLPYPSGDPNDVEPDIGEVGNEIDITSIFDGWGYIHLYDADSLEELDTFAIPKAMDPAYASGFGDLSVHEIATHPTNARKFYSAYYAAGLRAFRISDTDCGEDGAPCIKEVGGYLDPQGNNFWGVEMWRHPATGKLYILGSDRDSGLWIFRDKTG